MPAFHLIKPGDVLYDCRRTKRGSTTMSEWSCWPVKIIEVHEGPPGQQWALASWNGNPPKRMYPSKLRSYSRTEPKKYRDQKERHKKRG